MSDRLENPVECAGCGVATHEPSIAGNGDKLCPNCLDDYNKSYARMTRGNVGAQVWNIPMEAGEAANGGVK